MNQGRFLEGCGNCKGKAIDKTMTLGNWGSPKKWSANAHRWNAVAHVSFNVPGSVCRSSGYLLGCGGLEHHAKECEL